MFIAFYVSQTEHTKSVTKLKILNFDVFVNFKHMIYFFRTSWLDIYNQQPKLPRIYQILTVLSNFLKMMKFQDLNLSKNWTLIFKLFQKSLDILLLHPLGLIWVADYWHRVKKFEKSRSRGWNGHKRQNSIFFSLVTDFVCSVWEI